MSIFENIIANTTPIDYTILLALTILVIEKIIQIFKSRGIDLFEVTENIKKIYSMVMRIETDVVGIKNDVKTLYIWHDVVDEDGVKKWYIRSQYIKNIIEKLEKIEEKMNKLDNKIDRVHQFIKITTKFEDENNNFNDD